MPYQTEDLLNVQQAAELLHLSPRSVTRQAKAGLIPAMKLPGRTGAYVFDRDALELHLSRERAVS